MRKFLSILLTLVLFLSLTGCKINIPGFDNGNEEDEAIKLAENEKAFKEYLESNKMPTVEEIDQIYSKYLPSIELPEDMFVGKSLLKNTTSSVTIPYGDSIETADFYLYQKENNIYLAGIPRTFEEETVSVYFNLEYLEELYDNSKDIIPTDIKLSSMIDSLLKRTDAPFDFEELLSVFAISSDDISIVEYGKFQIKNHYIFTKILELTKNKDYTVEDLMDLLKKDNITLSMYVYFDNNLLKGYEVIITEESKPGEVMTVSGKLSYTYVENKLNGLEFKIFATDVVDATIEISYINDELILTLDLLVNNSVDLESTLKCSSKEIEFSALVEDLSNNKTISITAKITENSIDFSVKENDIEMIKCDIDISTNNFNTLNIDGSFTWTSYSNHQSSDDDYPVYETSVNTITFALQSGENVVIPEEVYALEESAKDIFEFRNSNPQPNPDEPVISKVECYYFESYQDNEGTTIEVGEIINDGVIVSDEWVTLKIDSLGDGVLKMEGAEDSQPFNYDVYAFETYAVSEVYFYEETSNLSTTIQKTHEGKVIFTIINEMTVNGEVHRYTQTFTLVNDRINVGA